MGKLIVPMAFNANDRYNLYSIDLNDNEKTEVFFEDENYDDICFPIKTNDGFICMARNLKQNNNVMLKVCDNNIKEIYTSCEKLYCPVLTDDDNIIYIKQKYHGDYLYKYSISNKTEVRIFDGVVDRDSRPVWSSEDSLLFVSKEKNEYVIWLYKKYGSIQKIANGTNPIWLEEGRKIIYYSSLSLHLYDIEMKTDNIIKNNIILIETPILSPDKQFLVFYERGKNVINYGIEDILSIMSINCDNKIQIKSYSLCKRLLGKNGILWLE